MPCVQQQQQKQKHQVKNKIKGYFQNNVCIFAALVTLTKTERCYELIGVPLLFFRRYDIRDYDIGDCLQKNVNLIICNHIIPSTMKNNLHVTAIQANLVWENKAANFKKFDEVLRGISSTDIIVLPEMFTTGFSMTPARFAESLFGETYQWLLEKSKNHDAAITGSFMCAENGHYYNRLLWVQPDGTHYIYDKRHLFSLAGEQNHYQAGVSRTTIQWRGWSICPLICYDLRFPVWSRNWQTSPFQADNEAIQDNYDLLIYVANWPQRRNHAWKTLLTARAIENQAFVVGVNRVGDDGNGIYHSGDTSIIDYAGEILQTRANTEGVDVAIFNREKLYEYRNKFGFLTDIDLFKFYM